MSTSKIVHHSAGAPGGANNKVCIFSYCIYDRFSKRNKKCWNVESFKCSNQGLICLPGCSNKAGGIANLRWDQTFQIKSAATNQTQLFILGNQWSWMFPPGLILHRLEPNFRLGLHFRLESTCCKVYSTIKSSFILLSRGGWGRLDWDDAKVCSSTYCCSSMLQYEWYAKDATVHNTCLTLLYTVYGLE